MLKRCCRPLLILSLVLPVLVLNCKHHDKMNPLGNKIVLQINNWTLTSDEMNRRIKKIEKWIEKWHDDYTKADLARKAVDTSLTIGLLITEAYNRGIDRDNEIINMALVNTAQEVHAELYKIRPNELAAALRRRNKELYLGHVWVKIDNQGVISRIVQQLRRGASIETMAKYREAMSRPKERDQVVFEIGTYSGGDMVEELERAAYRLKLGQVKVVKTKSGYHILQLLGIRLKPGEVVNRSSKYAFSNLLGRKGDGRQAGSIDVSNSLRRAKIREDGGLDIDRMKEEGKLKINKRMLDNISFPPKISMKNEIREPEDNQVVAMGLSQNITVGELKSEISKFPPRIQAKFENKYTREIAVRKLLKTEKFNRKQRDLVKSFPKIDEKSSVEINRDVLFKISIESLEAPKNRTILATYDGGKITVGRFREAIDSLPMEARPELNDLKNRREFLEYVIFSKFLLHNEHAQLIQINEEVLQAIDYRPSDYEPSVKAHMGVESAELHIFSEINKIQVPDRSEPIATFGEVSLTLGQLEEKFSSMSDGEKVAFNDKNKRHIIVENLLIEAAWIKEAHRLKLGCGYAMKREKERLMIEKLYNQEIVDRVVIADNEIEKYFPYTQFREEEIKRMDDKTKRDLALIMKQDNVFKKYFQQLRAKAKIAVDQDELAKWGIKQPEFAQ